MLLAAGVCLGLVSPTGPTEGQIASVAGLYQTTRGGEFTLEVVGSWLRLKEYAKTTAAKKSFQTFCLETSDFLETDTLYSASVAMLPVVRSDPAPGDGGAGAAAAGSVSAGSGWLYSQFARGVLKGYNYANVDLTANFGDIDRHASARLLQEAIWMLEGRIALVPTQRYVALAIEHLGSREQAVALGGAAFGVYGLALSKETARTTIYPVHVLPRDAQQRQAVHGVHTVPDGGTTAVLLAVALAALVALRRWLGNA